MSVTSYNTCSSSGRKERTLFLYEDSMHNIKLVGVDVVLCGGNRTDEVFRNLSAHF